MRALFLIPFYFICKRLSLTSHGDTTMSSLWGSKQVKEHSIHSTHIAVYHLKTVIGENEKLYQQSFL